MPPASSPSLYDIALRYRAAGLSVVGSRSKGANILWTDLQNRMPTDEELRVSFIEKQATMLAIICGAGSGNLEVLDIDTKYDDTGKVWHDLWSILLEYYKGQPPFAVVQTPTGGVHLYYRCEQIEGNLELANALFEGKKKCIIETRGHGGLVMAPPSAGYQHLDDRIPGNIPTITPDEREDIMSICRQFNKVFEVEGGGDVGAAKKEYRKSNHQFKITPWHDYNASDAFEAVLIEYGWTKIGVKGERDVWQRPGKESGGSATFHRTGRWFWAFSSNQDHFDTNHYYSPFDIYKTLKAGGDKGRATREIMEAGFGRKYNTSEEALIHKAAEHFASGDLARDIRAMIEADFGTMVEVGDSLPEDLDDLIDTAKNRAAFSSKVWWTEHPVTKKFSLNLEAFRDFLFTEGYRLFVNNQDDQTYRIIKVDPVRHQVYHVHLDVFKKELEAWVNAHRDELGNFTRNKLISMVMAITDTKIKSIIDFLPRINLDEIRFLKKAGNGKNQWFAFKNTVLKVTDQDYHLMPFSDLPPDMMVWRRDIKPYNFTLLDIELESEFNQCPIWIFFKRICGITKEFEDLAHDTDLKDQHPELYQRFVAMLTSVGYLISAFKNENEPYAPIFEENTKSSDQGGGTGKGLIFKIVGLVRNVVDIDCKIIDLKGAFAFGTVTLDTDVVHLEDVEKNFKMSMLNNIISNGLTVNRKYEQQFMIPYKHSPKIAVSSNYTLSEEADFEKRRQKKNYLERHYSKNFTPAMEIGMLFTEDWTEEQYNLCYNILMYCLQMYMLNGIIDAPVPEDAAKRYVVERYKEAFVDFCESVVISPDRLGKWQDFKELRSDYLKASGDNEKYWTKERFGRGVTDFVNRTDYAFVKDRIGREPERFSCIVVLENGMDVPQRIISKIIGHEF